MLIKKRQNTGRKNLNDFKAFIEYLNDMDDIYKNIEEYNPSKKRKQLIVFDDKIADMLGIKKINPIVTELLIRVRKLNIFLVFITLSYRLNSPHCFIMKIANKQELQQITFNHLSDIDFKDFMNLYKKMYCKALFFLVIDTSLASNNRLCFRKKILERI